MIIENNILKHYLKNVYFITGTAYAGKSTTVKMLSERYDMVFCGENYHIAVSDIVATPELQPDLCYRRTLTDWKGFVTRSPAEYERWIYNSGKEGAGFEIAELISLSKDKKVIVDTCIPLDVLKEISDYNHVAVMLSPQSMSVERFFDRSDPDKQFLLSVIDSCEDSNLLWKTIVEDLHSSTAKNTMTNMPIAVFSQLFVRIMDSTQEKKSAIKSQDILD